MVGDHALFSFAQLNTFTIEVEGILNSRPITSLSSDPNDILALTSAHYMIGRPLTSLPEGDLSAFPANRLSTWQHITNVRQDFWTRWNLEYFNELQRRHKWIKEGPKLFIGTIVVIKEINQPCFQWTLGKIVELYPSRDDIARSGHHQNHQRVDKRNYKASMLSTGWTMNIHRPNISQCVNGLR